MQVKVFEADDMPTALKLVKESLGPDALILSTRTLRKGSLGLLGKAVIEVTAAIEGGSPVAAEAPKPADAKPATLAAAPKPPVAAAPGVPRAYAGDDFDYNQIWRRKKVIDPLEEEVAQLKGQLSSINVESLRGEINELKELVRAAAQRGRTEPAAPRPRQGSALARMMDALLERGVEPGPAEAIIRQALPKYPPQNKAITLEGFLAAAIAELVRTSGPIIGPVGEGPRKVALVGPTGVGKTTTVAKLAADYLLQGGRRLALVTIDIYRIAAAEQLKVYGEIMKVPVEVVLTPADLQQVWTRHRDKELILIDTSGRSPRDGAGLAELESFIGEGSGVENHLVLSATTRDREAAGALKRFSRLPLRSLIFSKVDECESLGGLLNLHLKNNYPLSYLTTGQRVPEDMVLADPSGVASLIMRKQ
jgi:flagellar biosynthesis protein FlhF